MTVQWKTDDIVIITPGPTDVWEKSMLKFRDNYVSVFLGIEWSSWDSIDGLEQYFGSDHRIIVMYHEWINRKLEKTFKL